MKKCVLQYQKTEETQDNFELSDSGKPEILKKLGNMDPSENFNFGSKTNYELADNIDNLPIDENKDFKDFKEEDDCVMNADELGDKTEPIVETMPETNAKKQPKDINCISDSEESFNMSKNEIKMDKNTKVNFKKL